MRIETERQTAPEKFLCKAGNDRTFEVLCEAAQNLTTEELLDLEDDLRLYAETRLIGIHISRLVKLLRRKAAMTIRHATHVPNSMSQLG